MRVGGHGWYALCHTVSDPNLPTTTSILQRDDLDRRLLVQYAISRALAESETVEDALLRVLEEVCTQLGWQFGTFWLLDNERQHLECAAVWRSNGDAEFETTTRSKTFARGRGIPGVVWDSAEPVWMKDIRETDRMPRQEVARRAGLHGVFAFPVYGVDTFADPSPTDAKRKTSVIGVVELYSEAVEPPDEQMLNAALGMGFQLGVFLESRHAHEAGNRQRVRNATVVQTALDCIITIDHEGRILEWNPAAERVFGRPRDDVLGHQLAETIIPPQLRDAHYRGFARYLETGEGRILGKRIEVEGMRADGSSFPCELAVSRVPLPGAPTFTAYLRDLTAQRRLQSTQELLLRASKVLLKYVDTDRVLCDLSRVVVPAFADWYSVDVVEPDRTIRRLATLHRDPEKIGVATELGDRYANRTDSEYGSRAVIRSGQSQLVTDVTDDLLRSLARDQGHFGLLRTLGLHSFIIVPLRGRDAILGAITFVAAESGRRYDSYDLEVAEELAARAGQAIENGRLLADAESARREADEANRAKSEFLAAMSHELRTPLNAIVGYAQLLDVGIHGPVSDEQHVDLGRIQRSSQHLLGLITDILNFAKLESGRIEYEIAPIALDQALASVEELIAPLAASRNISYALRTDCPGVRVCADPEKLRQILINLLSNAIRYTEEGGKVTVTCFADDKDVRIDVTDTGVGIPPDKLDAIFEPFVQIGRPYAGQRQGTGLGLSISRDLAHGMGGDLTVRSEVGRGSVFTVLLRKA